MDRLLDRMEARHPGIKAYVRTIAAAMRIPGELALERFARGLEAAHEAAIDNACRELEELRVLPNADVRNDSQVASIWRSRIFQIYLNDVIRFYPPEGTDLRLHRPPEVQSAEHMTAIAPSDLTKEPYWIYAMRKNYPELYLDPFLPSGVDREFVGCDLACGWGRATFGQRHFDDRRIHCCDISTESLKRLEGLARSSRIRERVSLHECDVRRLSFAAEMFDFFLLFDVIGHLSTDGLNRFLNEILRCARPGAVLYAVIALRAFCPPATHLQDLTWPRVTQMFNRFEHHGRRFIPIYWSETLPTHFTFQVAQVEGL